jgi:hypothetical protein
MPPFRTSDDSGHFSPHLQKPVGAVVASNITYDFTAQSTAPRQFVEAASEALGRKKTTGEGRTCDAIFDTNSKEEDATTRAATSVLQARCTPQCQSSKRNEWWWW